MTGAAEGPTESIRVLVVCTGNSARSQMAEAFLTRAGGGRLSVQSAGTHPSVVHPLTIQVLAEHGIDWSSAESKGVDRFLDQPFDVVVTVCDDANEACPVFPGGGRRLHRSFVDPARATGSEAERLAAFRATAAEIQAWASELAAELTA